MHRTFLRQPPSVGDGSRCGHTAVGSSYCPHTLHRSGWDQRRLFALKSHPALRPRLPTRGAAGAAPCLPRWRARRPGGPSHSPSETPSKDASDHRALCMQSAMDPR